MRQDVGCVLAGKRSIDWVEHTFERPVNLVRNPSLAENCLLYGIPASSGRGGTAGRGSKAGAVARTLGKVNGCQNPSHRLTERINDTRDILAARLFVQVDSVLTLGHKLGSLGRCKGVSVSLKDGASDFLRDGTARRIASRFKKHLDHIRHQALGSRVSQQGVHTLGDSTDVVDVVDVQVDALALRAVNDVEAVGNGASRGAVRHSTGLIRTERNLDLGLAEGRIVVPGKDSILLSGYLKAGLQLGLLLE